MVLGRSGASWREMGVVDRDSLLDVSGGYAGMLGSTDGSVKELKESGIVTSPYFWQREFIGDW